MIRLNYEQHMIQSFKDAMSELTRQERAEYDKLYHLEQEHWWIHQNQEDEDNGRHE